MNFKFTHDVLLIRCLNFGIDYAFVSLHFSHQAFLNDCKLLDITSLSGYQFPNAHIDACTQHACYLLHSNITAQQHREFNVLFSFNEFVSTELLLPQATMRLITCKISKGSKCKIIIRTEDGQSLRCHCNMNVHGMLHNLKR